MKKDKKIRRELLDELLAGYSKPEDLTGPEGLLKRLSGALVERALGARRAHVRLQAVHRVVGHLDRLVVRLVREDRQDRSFGSAISVSAAWRTKRPPLEHSRSAGPARAT